MLWHPQSVSASTSPSSGVASSHFTWAIGDLIIPRNLERRTARYITITGRGYLEKGVTAKLEIEPGGAAGTIVVFDECKLADDATVTDLYLLETTGFEGNMDLIVNLHKVSLAELLAKAHEIANPGKKKSNQRGDINVGGDLSGNVVMGDNNYVGGNQ
jgi:hypothetical protein